MGVRFTLSEDKTNKTLIVTFCSLSGSYQDPPIFEFSSLLSKIATHCDRYFYMDETRSWYQYGVPYVSSTIDEFIDKLKDTIRGYENVVFLGISSGGYAAILFGSLLNVTTVISLLPQTVLTSEMCTSFWGSQYTDSHKYKDLLGIINSETKYLLVCAENIEGIDHPHGKEHCLRLTKYANIEIVNMHWEDGVLLRDKDRTFLRNLIEPHIY